jgi:hypothetical protein
MPFAQRCTRNFKMLEMAYGARPHCLAGETEKIFVRVMHAVLQNARQQAVGDAIKSRDKLASRWTI